MNTTPPKFPAEIQAKLMSLLHEVDGEYEIADMKAFIEFVAANGAAYPELLAFVNINETALADHYETTGEVPPGVKMVRTTSHEGSNVVELEVVHGPTPPKI